MLKITTVSGNNAGHTLKLEGKLVGPWVGELQRACEPPDGLSVPLDLDLSAVTFIDVEGMALLRTLSGRGIIVVSCSGLVAELLQGEGR